MAEQLNGRPLVAGTAQGRALRLDEPLSFWGGVDIHSGRIVDQHHPQHGTLISGRILVMQSGRGSSSSSSSLAEMIHAGSAPAAIVLAEPDVILAVGSLVAQALYGAQCPIIVVEDALQIEDGVLLKIDGGSIIRLD